MHYTPVEAIAEHAQPWQNRAERSCFDAIILVANHKSVPVRLLIHRSRGRLAVARARQIAMYLAHVMLGRSLTDIGLAFGRDRTTVSYACGLIEDMRDDRGFDEEICALERQLEDEASASVMAHGL